MKVAGDDTHKGLRVRLHGRTPAHVRRAAAHFGLVLKAIYPKGARNRPDGYYGYGNTAEYFDVGDDGSTACERG